MNKPTKNQEPKANIIEKMADLLIETSMASSGGVFGTSPEIGAHGGAVGNDDWYARGDARNVFGGYVDAKQGKKKKKKKNAPRGTSEIMPMAKRTLQRGI